MINKKIFHIQKKCEIIFLFKLIELLDKNKNIERIYKIDEILKLLRLFSYICDSNLIKLI